MNPRACFVFAATSLLLACAGCAATNAIPFEQGSDRDHFNIVLKEAGGGSPAFSCSASMTDLVSKRTIEAAPVEARAGASRKASKLDAASGATLEVALAVDEAGHVATCSATVRKGGRLIASDVASLEAR